MWRDYLWGKTNPQLFPGEPDFHHVLCHLVDVAVVAETILYHPRAGHWVERLSRVLGLEPSELRSRLPYLVGLHDLCKASPGFQAKWPEGMARLLQAGAPWPESPAAHLRHDQELGCILTDLLPDLALFEPQGVSPRRFYLRLTAGLASHHGSFFKPGQLREDQAEVPVTPDWEWQRGWISARAWLASELRRLLGTPAAAAPCRPGNLSTAAMLLNGLTILCDWIGSDTGVFAPSGFPPDMDAYVLQARKAAREAVEQRQLFSFLDLEEEPTFAILFPERAEPRSVQRAVDREAFPVLPSQFLAVIEAPMGEGKTEAAELLALRLAWQGGCQGFYFALPTVATSNQMYGRVRSLLQAAGKGASAALLALINGMAEFHPDIQEAMRTGPGTPAHSEEQRVAFDSWYLPRKRSLLAAYGVGTIDQALLGGLTTRHVGLRLFGLAGKAVIIDEVHAYDLYMSTILDRLLVWLRELGASVILLSATLPAERRAQLLHTFAPNSAPLPEPDHSRTPYPLITMAEREGELRTLPSGPATRQMEVHLVRRPDGEEVRSANAGWLLEELRHGGRAVWICNTVAEAQAVYCEFHRQAAALPERERPKLLLFHARFLMKDRQALEAEVLARFGPEANDATKVQRPVVLVATQVVEQSLDLDFDLMLTQLAPVDLLLQRLGRLWRHAHRTIRGSFTEPRFVLLEPTRGEEARPRFGATGIVYSPLILLRTLAALAGKTTLQLPGDIRPLIEAVYALDTPPSPDRLVAADLRAEWLENATERHFRELAEQWAEAAKRLLGEPDLDGGFYVGQNEEVEAAEVEHLAMQTRLGRPSVRVLLLTRADPLFALLHGSRRLDSNQVRQLLDRTVSLSYGHLVPWVRQELAGPGAAALAPPRLAEINALRGVVLLPLDGGRFTWPPEAPTHWLRLDDRLGIVFDRDEENLDDSAGE